MSLVLIIPVGFYSKFYAGPLAGWVNNSLGGLFYVIFWCLFVMFIRPKTNRFIICSVVFIGTSLIEFLQLWKPPVLTAIRQSFLGRTILGTSFSWSDFPYYLLGALLAYFWLKLLTNKFDTANADER